MSTFVVTNQDNINRAMRKISGMASSKNQIGGIKSIVKTETDFMIHYLTDEQAKLNILNGHVFKYYMSPTGNFLNYPKPHNPEDKAKIIAKEVYDYGRDAFENAFLIERDESFEIRTDEIVILFDKLKGTMTVFDKRTNNEVLNETKSLSYDNYKCIQTLLQHNDEHYFGGGMQSGRFTHKGKKIQIINSQTWVDGSIASPCPFYWSTFGYGVLRNTWQPGLYDFGFKLLETIETMHQSQDFDAFFFINSKPRDILNDYFELTGRPLFMPEYAFYEAHLNAYNRDYWVKVTPDTPRAILFEDGEYYKSYQPKEIGNLKGVLESLNGENDNYQFSARAVIDRYENHDMPLGWFLPNDGYGSGYGQTDSMDGDIQNLKEFADYARSHGVEVALWTESQVEPKDPQNPKKGERDLYKEIKVAGIVALKCDEEWIGEGYSFGLSAIENAAGIFERATDRNGRTMIFTVDGWAGTQRYAGIWSGDQKGGEWEYIRFHIPTYIGTGLSGQPVVGSDMDGIYAGKSREVNIRDYQWKTFTPLQLNMDGWGNFPKTPFSFDEEATYINRAYLKLKSMLMPYNYTIGHESTQGLPMVRAMFLEFPKETLAYTLDTQYQFMWGPSILVAPIYNPKGLLNASVRDGIYLPDSNQVWIDFFTGEKYRGGKILNNMKMPLWKIPVFIKDGAIIPMTIANNNPFEIKRDIRIFTIYPNDHTTFAVYEDDGKSSHYLDGEFAVTNISVSGPKSNEVGDLHVSINKTEGSYHKMVKERTTILQIKASKEVDHISVTFEDEAIKLRRVKNDEDFERLDDVFYFKEDFMTNPYLKKVEGASLQQKFLLVKIHNTDVTSNVINIKIKDYANVGKIFGNNSKLAKDLDIPSNLAVVAQSDVTSIMLMWEPVEDAQYYEIERDGIIFTNITETAITFGGFTYDSKNSFRIRSVNEDGLSEWSSSVKSSPREDPYKNTVKDIKVTCNVASQPGHAVENLVDGDFSTVWHTDIKLHNLADPTTGKTIKLNFDLGGMYELDKLEYYPQRDGWYGTILKLQYRHSTDGSNWSSYSEEITWDSNNKIKTIDLNGGSMRYVELNVLETNRGIGSGRQVMFYKHLA